MGILDKFSEKDAWVSEYAGHIIKVVNQGKATLYIDGEEDFDFIDLAEEFAKENGESGEA